MSDTVAGIVSKLTLNKGDIVVLRCEYHLSGNQRDSLTERVRECGITNMVLILDGGMDISVATSAQVV